MPDSSRSWNQLGFYGGLPRKPLHGVSAEVREKLLEIHGRGDAGPGERLVKFWFAAVLVAPFLFACGEAEPPRTHAGINVVLLTIDTLRADHLSSYGYQRQTSPAIDGLADRGVLFENAFTYWPKTRGSFAAMFTSLFAAQHGLTVRERDLPGYNQTLAEMLKDSGYQTAAAVDNGNLDRELGFAQGFDRYEQVWLTADTEAERTERLTRFAIDFLESYQQPEPFFLWIHYVNPHTPYEPPEELLDLFRGDEIVPRGPELETVVGYHGGVNRHLPIAGESRWGDYVDSYDAEIAFADRHVGHVLEALDKSPHNGSTLVVLTSDHGESLGEHDYYFDHGYNLFDPSLRVPLVLSFPGILPQGEIVQAAVSTLDIFPSVLDLAQIAFPPGLQGAVSIAYRASQRGSASRPDFFSKRPPPSGYFGRSPETDLPSPEGTRRELPRAL